MRDPGCPQAVGLEVHISPNQTYQELGGEVQETAHQDFSGGLNGSQLVVFEDPHQVPSAEKESL